MLQEKDNIAATLRKILTLERSRGFADEAATCGLEEFVEQHFPEAMEMVRGYGQATPVDRRRAVGRLLEYLETGPHVDGDARAPLAAQVDRARGVGAKRAALLGKLGIRTIEDLITYLPRRLEDRSQAVPIGELRPGETAGTRAQVLHVNRIRVHRGMEVTKAALGDGTGFLFAVWFNQPWIATQLPKGETIDLFGRVERNYGELQMNAPVWEPAGEGVETGRLVPIYPTTEGLNERTLRALILRTLTRHAVALTDLVPAQIRDRNALMHRRDAIRSIHAPESADAFERARRTLAFEELLLLQLGLADTARAREGRAHISTTAIADSFLAGLPFRLTPAQRAALREIITDLRGPQRMMRLLQGDVGSGKTIVAIAAALHVVEAGFQAVFMAPTELLAEQHADRLARLLADYPVTAGLLTASTKDKEGVKDRIARGEIGLLVGTHALIQEDVAFHALGLVVIDEQHRFGVVQRSRIEDKGEDVDLLVMSATPIPRTIALTLYGEFDVSIIDELPLGEKLTQTLWVSQSRRGEVYEEVRGRLERGGKGYVVLPLVEESEKLDLRAAVQVAEELRGAFPGAGVGLIHGRLATGDKQRAMKAFREGASRLIVSTTVIEVGIDVLDADFMVIEHAERFGLSQLHQLRGRIGRSGQPATCYAIATAKTEDARARLAAFAEHTDGFSIAEQDLLIRGPGDLLGTQQHGFLARLRAVDLIRDLELMGRARDEARRLAEDGPPSALLQETERRFGDVLRWFRV